MNFQLFAAPPAPFDVDGALQLSTVEKQAEHLRANGVDGAFICGTTGEFASLSVQERRELAAQWQQTADFSLLVHVGHTNIREACELAAHAESLCVAGIAAVAPFYYKTQGMEQTINWCARIAASAPATPFYYYHIPAMTGVSFPLADFVQKAAEVIPSFAGLKASYGDLADFAHCLTVAPDKQLFYGSDENVLPVLALGGRAVVGSSYNIIAPLVRDLVANFQAGDMEGARHKQKQIRDFVQTLRQFGGITALKSVLRWRGVHCGPCRAPLPQLSTHDEGHLRQQLAECGFEF